MERVQANLHLVCILHMKSQRTASRPWVLLTTATRLVGEIRERRSPHPMIRRSMLYLYPIPNSYTFVLTSAVLMESLHPPPLSPTSQRLGETSPSEQSSTDSVDYTMVVVTLPFISPTDTRRAENFTRLKRTRFNDAWDIILLERVVHCDSLDTVVTSSFMN